MKLEAVMLDKKELINKYLNQRCTQNSEFTFTNLFMWRKSYDIKYAIINDNFCLMPKHVGGPRSATFPLGGFKVKETIEEIIEYFEQKGEIPLIRLYNDEAVEELNNLFPDKFNITEDINSNDYVYRVEDLINLSGKKYHTKKNHINKFKSLYNYEYSRLAPTDADECLELYNKWYKAKVDENLMNVSEEYEAVKEFLDNLDALDAIGGCIRVDGKMVAFSFGEPLSGCNKTAVIHLEHADTDYQGAYPMINREFLMHEWSDFEFVNREEDMGLEGLRKAKLSYRPAFMVKKYVATLK